MMKKDVLFVVALLVGLVLLGGCDFGEREAIKSFEAILNALPAEDRDGWYQITSPDGGAKFAWINSGAALSIDAEPFLAAGLNTAKLEEGVPESTYVAETIFYEKDLRFTLPGWDMLNRNVKDSALEQFKADIPHYKVVETDDAYQIGFPDNYTNRPDAAMFAWARDVTTSERDLVFTINAEMLIAAGVEPENVDGWELVTHPDGTQVFQKAIDVKG
jgi:hypothetical protein